MPEVEAHNTKSCSRCGHIWQSYVGTPVRCPFCGTYHWNEAPRTNICISCGHRWYSRSDSPPARCPRCKTRSWFGDLSEYHNCENTAKPNRSAETGNITDLYHSGLGCVKISMKTGMSIERVMGILSSELGNTHLRMRRESPLIFHSSL